VTGFLDGAKVLSGDTAMPNLVTPRQVSEVMQMAQSVLLTRAQPPVWLDTGEPGNQWLACSNAAVNLATGEVRPASPDLWTMSSAKFAWNAGAKAPTWEWWLNDTWPGDQGARDFVEEWVGYCMTEDTQFQKALMLIGPPRSGKGLLTHVIKGLAGEAGYAAFDLNQWTGPNEREGLIGAKVAVASDTKLKEGRMYGASFDAGGLDYKSVGFLLQYIGGDTVTIGRKNIRPWTGALNAKFMLLGNAPLNLNDRTGVLPTRFITLATLRGHVKDADVTLLPRLLAELPGIAVRCAEAYRRLLARRAFVQPKVGERLAEDTAAASDWRLQLLRDCFVVEAGAMVSKVSAHSTMERWIIDNGRKDLLATWTIQKAGKLLREIVPELSEFRPGGNGQRMWVGLRSRKESER
jgi:putative DNA primase/helicase